MSQPHVWGSSADSPGLLAHAWGWRQGHALMRVFGHLVSTHFMGSSCEPGPGLDLGAMEKEGQLSGKLQSNGRDVPWTRLNRDVCQL